MSNYYATAAVITFIGFLIWVILQQHKRLKSALSGQREWKAAAERNAEERDDYKAELHGAGRHTTSEWREIAFYHARAAKGRDTKTQWVEESNARLLHDNQAWSEQFRHLVVFIWDDPPLERTIKDVCDFISNLRAGVAQEGEKAVKLTAAYAALSDRLRELEARLTSSGAETAARASETASVLELFDFLATASVGLTPDIDAGFIAMPVCTTGTPIAQALVPLECAENARLAIRRAQEGLSS